MPDLERDAAKAVIESGNIVIRVPIANLQTIMDGGFGSGAYERRYRVLDAEKFAKEIADQLNDEAEDGTTAVHTMFDKAINEAIERGAQHADEHPEQSF